MTSGDGWHEFIDQNNVSLGQKAELDIEQHLTFLEFNEEGKLLLGSCNLVDRTYTGSVWVFSDLTLPLTAQNCLCRQLCSAPVSCGTFTSVNNVIVADDSGAITSYQLDELENDGLHFIPKNMMSLHDSWIPSLSSNKNGTIVSAGADMRINVVDTEEGSVQNTYFPAHSHPVVTVAAKSMDKDIFASCSMDQLLLLWDTRLPRPAKAVTEGDCGFTTVAWKDENSVLVGSETGLVDIFDVRSSGSIQSMKLQEKPIHKLAYNEKGFLASCSDSSTVTLWEFDSNKMLNTPVQHTMPVRGLAWNPKTDDLYSCGLDGNVCKYRIES